MSHPNPSNISHRHSTLPWSLVGTSHGEINNTSCAPLSLREPHLHAGLEQECPCLTPHPEHLVQTNKQTNPLKVKIQQNKAKLGGEHGNGNTLQ